MFRCDRIECVHQHTHAQMVNEHLISSACRWCRLCRCLSASPLLLSPKEIVRLPRHTNTKTSSVLPIHMLLKCRYMSTYEAPKKWAFSRQGKRNRRRKKSQAHFTTSYSLICGHETHTIFGKYLLVSTILCAPCYCNGCYLPLPSASATQWHRTNYKV